MKWSIEKKVMAGVGIALVLLLVNAIISYRATRTLIANEQLVAHTHQVLTELEATLSTMKDAETGARGYIITRQENFLEPYNTAVDQIHNHIENLRRLMTDNPIQRGRIPLLERNIADILANLKRQIDREKIGDVEGARRFVSSNAGKQLMDDLRQFVNVMEDEEKDLLKQRSELSKASGRDAFLTNLIPNLIACALILLITYITVRDVTASKRTEKALYQQRELLQVTLASIGDAVIATDTHGHVTFTNSVAESLTGWQQQEAEGRPLQEVFKIINEQTRQPVENPALRTIKEGMIVGLANHTVLITKQGTEIPIDDSGAPIKDIRGKILGAVLIFRDITKRKRTEVALRAREAELELIINQTPFMLTRCSRDLRYSFVSQAYAEMIGRQPEELVSKPIVEIMGEDGFKTILPHVEKVLDGHRVEYESQVHFQGIGPHFLQVVYMPDWDKQGNVNGWIASILDISERKQAEEERSRLLARERAAREQAETASHAKDEFVALISHEIRSPLNSILGWVQLLRTDKFDRGETQRALETIERNAKTQVQLIEDLLDISRVVTGKLTLQVRPVELTQIIELALDSIRPAAEAKRIQLQVRLVTLGSTVSGDPARLQQIIWNLLSNAVKFTPAYGCIEIRMERINSHLHFTVSDSGVGISPEFLPYVFDRFSQANTSCERKYGGLGLGLAIVRHLAELHGGTVSADSPGDGQGATFTVSLPVRSTQEEIAEFKHISPSAESLASFTETIKLDDLRIMVVDDEAESRELLFTMLTRRGAKVIACASAAEALSMLTEWRPAVLVSDIGMPEEDGYALIRKLRALDPACGGNVPAVALTGYARNEDRMRALAAGFQMHVPKPVEAAELIVVIASLAGRLDKSGIG